MEFGYFCSALGWLIVITKKFWGLFLVTFSFPAPATVQHFAGFFVSSCNFKRQSDKAELKSKKKQQNIPEMFECFDAGFHHSGRSWNGVR